jgi:hypothetical protein
MRQLVAAGNRLSKLMVADLSRQLTDANIGMILSFDFHPFTDRLA